MVYKNGRIFYAYLNPVFVVETLCNLFWEFPRDRDFHGIRQKVRNVPNEVLLGKDSIRDALNSCITHLVFQAYIFVTIVF